MKWRRQRPIPKRPNGRGFPRIKRSFGAVNGEFVGQINVSSGTNDPATYHRIHTMLDDLAERGDAETLVRIRNNGRQGDAWGAQRVVGTRHYEVLEVLREWKGNRHVPTITGWRPLEQTMMEWLEKRARTASSVRLSPRTIASYENNKSQLLKHAARSTGPAPTNSDLPRLLASYRSWCIEREYWVPFNQTRTMCLSYARQMERDGRDSELYRAIRRVAGLTTTRKRERANLTVREVLEVMRKLPDREAQHVWNMCCLATRPDEYARNQWEIVFHDDYGTYVQINGTKTAHAKRPVPLVNGVSKVRFVESTFRRRLREVVGDAYLPRDFRSTGKRWRKEAGISASRCQQYFGHSMSSMEHRYDTDDLLKFVEADAKLMNDYLDKETAAVERRSATRRQTADAN